MSVHPIDYLVHFSNILLLVSYSVRNILWLRWFAVAAALTNMPYFLYQPNILWPPILWAGVFTAINLYQIWRLYMGRRPVTLTADDRTVYVIGFLSLPHAPCLRGPGDVRLVGRRGPRRQDAAGRRAGVVGLHRHPRHCPRPPAGPRAGPARAGTPSRHRGGARRQAMAVRRHVHRARALHHVAARQGAPLHRGPAGAPVRAATAGQPGPGAQGRASGPGVSLADRAER